MPGPICIVSVPKIALIGPCQQKGYHVRLKQVIFTLMCPSSPLQKVMIQQVKILEVRFGDSMTISPRR